MKKLPWKSLTFVLALGVLYLIGFTHARFLAGHQPPWFGLAFSTHDEHDDHDHDDHDDDGHDHDGHSDEDGHDHGSSSGTKKDSTKLVSTKLRTLELSFIARKNLGLTDEFLRPIHPTSYARTLTVPGLVVDRPGRTRLPVSSAMTGLVTHVHAVAGEAIESGDLILEMRLTHEDVVTAQKEFLESLGNLDVELKEINRLDIASRQGALSPKTLLEREYNRDKLESQLRAQREALRLHGLTDSQLDTIEKDRKLLTEIRIYAPNPDNHSDEEIQLSDAGAVRTASSHNRSSDAKPHLLVMQELNVQKGQIVNAGQLLCTLADYDSLLIEGQAFENEASLIASAKRLGWDVSAVLENGDGKPSVQDLKIGWLENEVDPKSRTLRFFVPFPNVLEHDAKAQNGQRFVEWRYRVGQRVKLRVPVEQWNDQFVVPLDAVVREGADSFVFRWNGKSFERVPVHERFRDQVSVVIEHGGALNDGDTVALRGAHQMQLALQSQSGGGVDPHAGHNH